MVKVTFRWPDGRFISVFVAPTAHEAMKWWELATGEAPSTVVRRLVSPLLNGYSHLPVNADTFGIIAGKRHSTFGTMVAELVSMYLMPPPTFTDDRKLKCEYINFCLSNHEFAPEWMSDAIRAVVNGQDYHYSLTPWVDLIKEQLYETGRNLAGGEQAD